MIVDFRTVCRNIEILCFGRTESSTVLCKIELKSKVSIKGRTLFFFALQPNGETPCDSVGPVGCVYEDALLMVEPEKINQLQIDVTHSDFPDVTLCLRGCLSVFPDSLFAAIRHKSLNESQTLDCRCLGPNAFNSSTVGPDAKCTQVPW